MAVTEFDNASEVRTHRRTLVTFERLVLFAVLHITLTLACLALAFIGHAPLIALLLGVGGTLALIAGFAVSGADSGS
jgi:4-hydroxybenzoate polyprenyltransferase